MADKQDKHNTRNGLIIVFSILIALQDLSNPSQSNFGYIIGTITGIVLIGFFFDWIYHKIKKNNN